MKRVVFTALVAGLALLLASAAHADDVFIGLGANGLAPGVVAASATGAASLPPSLIVGWTVSATVFGTPPAGPEPNLEGFTVDASDTSGGISSLQIYITEGSLSSPTGINTFISGLTSNLLLGSIASVTESTYIDTANGLFTTTCGTCSLLATNTFTGIGSLDIASPTPILAAPYSETEVFNIQATGVGTVQDTITISNAPEPGTLTLFGSGLFGLAGLLRRKLAL
jgi:PEP-CTERM motif-containing protein